MGYCNNENVDPDPTIVGKITIYIDKVFFSFYSCSVIKM